MTSLVKADPTKVAWGLICDWLDTQDLGRMMQLSRFHNAATWSVRKRVFIKMDRRRVADPYLAKFIQERKSLTKLQFYIEYANRETDCTIPEFNRWLESLGKLPHIKSLLIFRGNSSTIWCISQQFENLRHLDISNFVQGGSEMIPTALLSNLRTLKLNRVTCIQISDIWLNHIYNHLVNCEVIAIDSFYQNCMQAIFGNLETLREFYLTQSDVDDCKLDLIVDSNPNLEVLHIPAWKLSMKSEIKFGKIAELTHLRHLDLSNYLRIVDGHISMITNANPQLTKLIIDGCVELTSNSTKCVARDCPKMRYLSMEKCYKMTDEIIPHVAQLPLNFLNIVLSKVTDMGIRTYCETAQYSHGLINLDIRRTAITKPMANLLFQSFPNLANIASSHDKKIPVIARMLLV